MEEFVFYRKKFEKSESDARVIKSITEEAMELLEQQRKSRLQAQKELDGEIEELEREARALEAERKGESDMKRPLDGTKRVSGDI